MVCFLAVMTDDISVFERKKDGLKGKTAGRICLICPVFSSLILLVEDRAIVCGLNENEKTSAFIAGYLGNTEDA
jgi:hypothetical protein